MKISIYKIILALAAVALLACLFSLAAFAATPGTGYAVNNSMEATNIKWTMTEDGTLTFEIDGAATDKVQTTELFRKDPITGQVNQYNKNLPTYSEAVKIVIGDGITKVTGFSAMKNLEVVELAESVSYIDDSSFQSSTKLRSIYIKGKDAEDGHFDLSCVTKLGSYAFDGVSGMRKLTFSADLAGEIPRECFKGTYITELEIPAGVTTIVAKAFMRTYNLSKITVLGTETVFESDAVFSENNSRPTIVAKKDSKAAEFAKANGYTFVDIDSGEQTGENAPVAEVTPPVTDFKPEGATLWGHSSGEYQGSTIVDTWWAYYDDTKTLEFVSATAKYNETGTLASVDKEYTFWGEYKNQIEHIIIGDNISKISNSAFTGHTALKDVRMGKNVNQIDTSAFLGCTSLTTIWRDGTERIEGRADFSGISNLKSIVEGTAIEEILLPRGTAEIGFELPPSLKTIYTYEITDKLIAYAEKYLFNLQSLTDPSVKYEYYVELDNDLPKCGARCAFDFDESTGTMNIYGAGMIDDITNYYGGGSKTQPWFDIRKQVKHIVIDNRITAIGKYAFCEFTNLETVQIPNTDGFTIGNAVFEKCYNLKSVYRLGDEPIEGTADVRNVHELNSFTFAYNYLIANVIISPEVEKIGSSVFEENITLNLANIYGTPGSYAEKYASENNLAFFDISSNTPKAITCIPPETTGTESEKAETSADPVSDAVTTEMEAKTEEGEFDNSPVTKVSFVNEGDPRAVSEKSSPMPLIIAAVAVGIIALAVVILVALKKSKGKSPKA